MANEFSCCHAYAKCNYGRNECAFVETEPEKKKRCRCYKIKHSMPLSKDSLVDVNDEEVIRSKQIEDETGLLDQLSLF